MKESPSDNERIDRITHWILVGCVFIMLGWNAHLVYIHFGEEIMAWL